MESVSSNDTATAMAANVAGVCILTVVLDFFLALKMNVNMVRSPLKE